jgi:hypothetical protein
MTKRSRMEIDRDHAVSELRAVIRKINESTDFAEIRDLAGELQRTAYDLEDWAERSRTERIAPQWLLIRRQRAQADQAVFEALTGNQA